MSLRMIQAFLACGIIILGLWASARYLERMTTRLTGMDRKELDERRAVRDRIRELGPRARESWQAEFRRRNLTYPPQAVRLVSIKEALRLDVYALSDLGKWTWVRTYPVLGQSGGLGPKLRQGDRQVPEGIYPVESLNPRSRLHVALRLGYPNRFDLDQAAREGRTDLGGDIMIHGGSASVGCLAMGDPAAEDLFVLAADVRVHNVTVVIAPVDFRRHSMPAGDGANRPPWTRDLYASVAAALNDLPPPVE